MIDSFKDEVKIIGQNLHVFDSNYGSRDGGGVIFGYQQPFINYNAYRVSFVTIYDFLGIATSSVYYVTGSSTSATNSNYINGRPLPVISTIPRSGISGPLHLYNHHSPMIKISDHCLRQISFQLRDENFNLISNARFIVGLVLYTYK